MLIARRRNMTGDHRFPLVGPVYASSGTGLLGYQERMSIYVDLVEEASGQLHLDRITLIPIRSALGSQCTGSISINRRWCDVCFQEDARCLETSYDRFLWALAPIERCPIHRLKLREVCPKCRRHQRHHHSSGDPRICMHCSESLVGPPSERVPALRPSFGERDCLSLIGAISSGYLSACAPDAVKTFEHEVAKARPSLARSLREISEPSGLARSRGYLVRPSLRTLLSKSYMSGVSVVDLLRDPQGAAKVAGNLVPDRNMVPAATRVQHENGLEEEVRKMLESYLSGPPTEKLPSLRMIARLSGVSTSYIWRHLRRVAERYQLHRRATGAKRTLALRIACMNELERVLADPAERSRLARKKDLETHLVRRTGCTYPTARGVAFFREVQGKEEELKFTAQGRGSKSSGSAVLRRIGMISEYTSILRKQNESVSNSVEE